MNRHQIDLLSAVNNVCIRPYQRVVNVPFCDSKHWILQGSALVLLTLSFLGCDDSRSLDSIGLPEQALHSSPTVSPAADPQSSRIGPEIFSQDERNLAVSDVLPASPSYHGRHSPTLNSACTAIETEVDEGRSDGYSAWIVNGLRVGSVVRHADGRIHVMPYTQARAYCRQQHARLASTREWVEFYSLMLRDLQLSSMSRSQTALNGAEVHAGASSVAFWSTDRHLKALSQWTGHVEYTVFNGITHALEMKSSEISPEGEDLEFGVLCMQSIEADSIEGMPDCAEVEDPVFGSNDPTESDENESVLTQILREQMMFCPIRSDSAIRETRSPTDRCHPGVAPPPSPAELSLGVTDADTESVETPTRAEGRSTSDPLSLLRNRLIYGPQIPFKHRSLRCHSSQM